MFGWWKKRRLAREAPFNLAMKSAPDILNRWSGFKGTLTYQAAPDLGTKLWAFLDVAESIILDRYPELKPTSRRLALSVMWRVLISDGYNEEEVRQAHAQVSREEFPNRIGHISQPR